MHDCDYMSIRLVRLEYLDHTSIPTCLLHNLDITSENLRVGKLPR